MTHSDDQSDNNIRVECPACHTAIPVDRENGFPKTVRTCPSCKSELEIKGGDSPRVRLMPRSTASVEFRRLCPALNMPDGSRTVYTLDNRKILVLRTDVGFYEVKNMCPHQGVELSGTTLENGFIRCPGHGYRFELKTGSCDRAQDLRASTFEVTIRGQELWIRL